MSIAGVSLEAVVADAFARRVDPVRALADDATTLALACRDMAGRFSRGGRLLVFGNGAGATDAQHVAVEFVHPVIVGKRALPALSLVSDAATLMGVASRRGLDGVYEHQVQVLGRPDDIALGISGDGNCTNVRAGLRAAAEAGLLTVALVGGDGGAIAAGAEAEHCLLVRSDDPRIVKEGHVTAYHLLWELVHVFFDSPEAERSHASGGVEQLYPFLYGGGSDATPVLAAAAESARQKIGEIVELRSAVGAAQGAAVATCAEQLAKAFAAGGTLLAFGNGGSSTDAQDVVHTFIDPPPPAEPLPALGLTNDVAVLTALSNDVSFEVVFSRQVRAFGRPGDIAVAISTSGGSPNVLAAIEEADKAGLMTIGLAGYGGGRMAEMASLQHLFAVPSSSVHRVQEVQTTLYHVLWEATRAALAS
ncbi:MAG: D-sedoheptulose 7-phosphate isomerase [Actinomycetota bacterium]|nr:D-sedoheptulose 7-phosphate isomerase [Actinomycetota bacterium]MDQ1643433.1 D-sedoheptulose 7-phosphate isomerase [Actinomycetota bacterium]